MAESVEPDPKVAGYVPQWWKDLKDYPRQKVQFYLGKLVDCSNPMKSAEWWSCLDTNDGSPVREIAQDAKNLQVNPRGTGGSQSDETKGERRTEFDGSAGITPHKSVKIDGGFHLKRVVKSSSKNSIEYEDEETITFHQNIDEDIVYGQGHTKFELELCDFLLRRIDSILEKEIRAVESEIQKATDEELVAVKRKQLKLESVKMKLGGVMKNQDTDIVARFGAFVKDGDEIVWGMVADACYAYFARDRFSSTHYVHCITLGTMVQKSEASEDTTKTTSANAEAKGLECVDGGGKISRETEHKTESAVTVTRGTKDKVEVIAVTTRPVSNLISDKSDDLSKLKLVVAKLIKCHNVVNEGEEAGPFFIYCIKKKSIFGKPTKIYWQVAGEGDSPEIHGTTNSKDASPFYIKYITKDASRFYIIHKIDSKYPRYATIKRPYHAAAPLQLWSAGDDQDICFTKEASVNKKGGASNSLPDTTHEWTQQDPVFIKLPYGNGWLNWIWKIERYAGMQEDGKSYKTISYHKRPENEKGRNMWLFSFENAPSQEGGLGGPPPPPPQNEDKEEILDWSDDDEAIDRDDDFYKLVGEEYVFPFQVIPALS